MPITPLRFGINGTTALLLPSRIDLLSCLLANVLLDLQPFAVIFLGLDIELHGASHSLLFGLSACLLFFTLYGIVVNRVFHKTRPLSVYILGGLVGGLLHIALDAFYHADVLPFYPFSNRDFAHLHLSYEVDMLSLLGLVSFAILASVRLFRGENHAGA